MCLQLVSGLLFASNLISAANGSSQKIISVVWIMSIWKMKKRYANLPNERSNFYSASTTKLVCAKKKKTACNLQLWFQYALSFSCNTDSCSSLSMLHQVSWLTSSTCCILWTRSVAQLHEPDITTTYSSSMATLVCKALQFSPTWASPYLHFSQRLDLLHLRKHDFAGSCTISPAACHALTLIGLSMPSLPSCPRSQPTRCSDTSCGKWMSNRRERERERTVHRESKLGLVGLLSTFLL